MTLGHIFKPNGLGARDENGNIPCAVCGHPAALHPLPVHDEVKIVASKIDTATMLEEVAREFLVLGDAFTSLSDDGYRRRNVHPDFAEENEKLPERPIDWSLDAEMKNWAGEPDFIDVKSIPRK